MNRLSKVEQTGPKIRFAGKVAVVPRAACRLERVWMPARTREGFEAARLSLGQNLLREGEFVFLEPAADPGPGHVNAWICSPEAVDAGRVWLPEPYLRQPGTTGPRLVQCTDGYEGQVWSDSTLIASRWWPIPPGPAEWLQFINGADAAYGLPETGADWSLVPGIDVSGWREDLNLLSLGRDSLGRIFTPARILMAGLILLTLPYGYHGGALVRLNLFMDGARADIARLDDRNRAISQSQRSAVADAGYALAQAQAGDPMLIADALTDLRLAFADSGPAIHYVSLAGRAMELRLSTDEMADIPGFVARLESTQTWNSVSASTNRAGELVVKGQLVSRRKD